MNAPASSLLRRSLGPLVDAMPSPLSLLAARANEQGREPALFTGTSVLSWAALQAQKSAWAATLHGYDVAPGHVVALALGDPRDWVGAFFGALELGASVVSLSEHLGARAAEERARVTGAKVCVSDRPAALACLRRLDPRSVKEQGRPPLPAPIEARTPAIHLFTSGTTTAASRVVRTHENLFAEATAFPAAATLGPKDTTLCLSPLDHSYGLGNGLLASLATGAPLIVLEPAAGPFEALCEVVVDLIVHHRPRVLHATPMQYAVLLEAAPPRALESLRLCFASGGATRPALCRAFFERFGVPIRQIYGATETGTIAAMLDPWPFDPRSVGRPVPGITLARDASEIAGDGPSSYWISGPSVVRGYAQAQSAEASTREGAAFGPRGYRTGDLLRMDEAGRIIVAGRKTSFVEIGGHKVNLQAVESVLLDHPSVRDAVVVARTQEAAGRAHAPSSVLRAVVVAGERVSSDELARWCAERLAGHEIPREFDFRASLERTPAGKLPSATLSRLAESAARPALALHVDGAGILDHLEWRATDATSPGPHEVEVEVQSVGVNFVDVMMALGLVPDPMSPDMPRIGSEFSGVVTRVGAEVHDVAPSDLVFGLKLGCARTRLVVDARLVVRGDPNDAPANAVSLPVAFATAWLALVDAARVGRGDWVLVHTASGAVGWATVALARHLGARVVATAGTAEKRRALAGMGVEHVFDSRSRDFVAGVLSVTRGRGVDVVVNTLAGDLRDANVEVLAPRGRFVELAKRDLLAGRPLATQDKDIEFHPVDLWRSMEADPARIGALLRHLSRARAEGWLEPCRTTIFPASAAATAFRTMASAAHVGKIVLDTSDPALRPCEGDRAPRGALAQQCRDAPTAVAARAIMLEALVRMLERTPALAGRALDVHASLRDLGLDSLASQELRTRIERGLAAPISVTDLWRFPSLDALARALAARVRGEPSDARPERPSSMRAPDSGIKFVEGFDLGRALDLLSTLDDAAALRQLRVK